MVPNLGPADRTLNEVAARAGIYEGDARKALDSMEAEGLVHRDTDVKLNIEFWIALNEAAERLAPPQ